MKIFNSIAFAAPDILLPREDIDLSKWAVIACDQYTSEIEYWNKVEAVVGDSPSALRAVLPEVYLPLEDEKQQEARLANIKNTINSYLDNGIWQSGKEGFIVLDRSTPVHPSRKGLVAAFDLEQYSYTPGNTALIRATEGTVLSRIPPRVKIRANARVELPHIMILIDDPNGTVVEKAWETASASGDAPCYDTDLMENAGHLKGFFLGSDSDAAKGVVDALTALKGDEKDKMLFAVGDGNHSLASAKAHWDNIKANLSEEERLNHPARFALAEIVNIHDKGLDFEPIHRVVFGISRDEFIAKATEHFTPCGLSVSDKATGAAQEFVITSPDGADLYMSMTNPPHSLAVGSVQMFIDEMNYEVDYIHGEDSVRKLSADSSSSVGILMPDISKNAFFDTIAKEGVFPRKTFSMGEAFEKRFYLEAKRIDG
ncbi:MAG: DUF1015 domain-containing protein [Saccharofermentans sp.]|nr:DUF1015 domain-containing protein [Saccharofermentans sp.]